VSENKIFIIVLIGDDPILAEREVIYSLDSLNIYYKFIQRKDLLLFLESNDLIVNYLIWRCSMVRYIIELKLFSNIDDIINKVFNSNVEWEISKNQTIAVKVKSYDKEYKKYTNYYQAKIGEYFYLKGYKINLENPDVIIFGIIKENNFYLGKLLGISKRKVFEIRRPSKRPFFHSSSMIPKIARLIVNLSKVPINESLVDPFCGAGSIIIEAALILNHVIGIDIDKKMIFGAKKNIKYYNLYNVDLILANSLYFPLRKAEYISTDLPYGIASSLKGYKKEELAIKFLESVPKFKSACITTNVENLDKYFKPVFKHLQYVRKSLIRYFYCFEYG